MERLNVESKARATRFMQAEACYLIPHDVMLSRSYLYFVIHQIVSNGTRLSCFILIGPNTTKTETNLTKQIAFFLLKIVDTIFTGSAVVA